MFSYLCFCIVMQSPWTLFTYTLSVWTSRKEMRVCMTSDFFLPSCSISVNRSMNSNDFFSSVFVLSDSSCWIRWTSWWSGFWDCRAAASPPSCPYWLEGNSLMTQGTPVVGLGTLPDCSVAGFPQKCCNRPVYYFIQIYGWFFPQDLHVVTSYSINL